MTASAAFAGTIDISTWRDDKGGVSGHGVGAGEALGDAWSWNYTGDFSDPRNSLYSENNSVQRRACIGFGGDCNTNDSDNDGSDEYAGFEYIYYAFDLPGDAANVSLSFDRLSADDRLVVDVNDTFLGAWGGRDADNSYPVEVSNHRGADGFNTFEFTGSSGNGTVLDDQSLFNVGGQNVIRFWVNNTNSLLVDSSPRSHFSSGDTSALNTRGTVNYEIVAVPAPATGLLVPIALLLLGLGRICRRTIA